MSPHFFAGFAAAWSAIYLAAFFYCFWSSQRDTKEPGDLQLSLFCLSNAVFAIATLLFCLADVPSLVVSAVAMIASTLAPAILFDFVSASAEAEKIPRRIVGITYVVFLIASALAAMSGLAGKVPEHRSLAGLTFLEPGTPTLASNATRVMTALLVLVIAYREGKLFVSARRGLGAFLGAVALTVGVTHDAAMSLVGGTNLMLAPFAFSAFALGLFISLLARFQSRRGRLIKKTRELQERSQALSKAFKELRAAQTELVRKEQLAAIGELSAVVAHEVRNPLAIITNAVATLRREEVRPEDRGTLLKILEEETSRLNQLVGDLLHYAKPLAPEPQLVSIRELIDRALTPLNNRVDLSIDILEPTAVGRIGGDPMLLRQAIDNVVNNAVQAMPSGGTLTISLQRTGEGAQGRVTIAISDTGEGMDTVVRKRALDPFFTTRPAGTGLGLAIVARVVDAHGGQLTIRSAPGAGTEVGMVLPVEPGDTRESRRQRLSLSNISRESLASIPEITKDDLPILPAPPAKRAHNG